MDFAFSALIILVLCFPGIFFRFGYKHGIETYIGTNDGIGDLSLEIAKGILLAAFIHLIATALLPHIPYCLPVNFNAVFNLLSGDSDKNTDYQIALDNLSDHFVRVAIYILSTSLIGFLLGIFCRYSIKVNFLDVKYPIFRMQNPWEYFFNGGDEVLALLESPGQKMKYLSLRKLMKQEVTCYVSLLVDASPGQKLINGIVADYDFNGDGELDWIVLEEASLMGLISEPLDVIDAIFINSGDPKTQEILKKHHYVKIEGDRFVVPYSTVKNMNAVFTFRQTEKEGGPNASSKSQPPSK
jgi:hypothetical protein